MNKTIAYNWTPEIGRLASHACVKATVGRLWFFLMAGLIFVPIGLLDYFRTNGTTSLAAAFFGLYCVVLYAYRKASIRRQVRDTARIVGNSKIELTLADDALVFNTDDAHITIRWNQITRIRRISGFMILFSGKLLRAAIPEQFMSEEQINFIEASVSTGDRRERRQSP